MGKVCCASGESLRGLRGKAGPFTALISLACGESKNKAEFEAEMERVRTSLGMVLFVRGRMKVLPDPAMGPSEFGVVCSGPEAIRCFSEPMSVWWGFWRKDAV